MLRLQDTWGDRRRRGSPKTCASLRLWGRAETARNGGVAEREGFEPSVPRKEDNGFRDRPVRPLRHLSIKRRRRLIMASPENETRNWHPIGARQERRRIAASIAVAAVVSVRAKAGTVSADAPAESR